MNYPNNVIFSFNNLKKYYKRKLILDIKNYSFIEGKCYAIIGENGSGKSTLLKILLGIVIQSKGICYKNPIYTISYLPDNINLPYYISVNNFLNKIVDIKKVDRLKKQKLIDDNLNYFGIMEAKFKRIGALSKGMKQKIMIIQAIINNPNVLIFDEAINGLDNITQEKLFSLITYYKNNGKTIILTTHYLDKYRKIIDTKLTIKNASFD